MGIHSVQTWLTGTLYTITSFLLASAATFPAQEQEAHITDTALVAVSAVVWDLPATTTPAATTTPPIPKPPRLTSPFGCSCVQYVRSKSTFTPPKVVSAKDIPALMFEPKVGAWLLWKPGPVYTHNGHVSYIEAILPDRKLFISEHNFEKCRTTTRIVDPQDPLIRGYFDTRHY